MALHEDRKTGPVEELPDPWWHKVYLAVILTTIIVIGLLWAFSEYFSN